MSIRALDGIRDLSVRDVMQSEVVSVGPEQKVQEVAAALMKKNIHGIPVVDRDNRVVGIVTESDFFMKDRVVLHIPSFMDIIQKTMVAKALGDADRMVMERILSAQVRDIMTAECTTVPETASLRDLLKILSSTHYKTIPVIDDDYHLIGVVTAMDVLTAIAEPSFAASRHEGSSDGILKAR